MGPARLLLAATFALWAGVAHAEPVELNAEALRRLADTVLAAGYAEQAIAYTDALLLRDAGDATALILKARALRLLERYPESEAVARLAWAAAKTDTAKYGAAITLAQALSLQGDRTAAQLWLRTAIQYAPNPRAKAQAIRDFGYVRGQNPLSLHFDLSLQPSDNVNNGTFPQIIFIPGLPPSIPDEALSGVTAEIGLSGRYRLQQSETRQTDLTFGAIHQQVWLQPDATDFVPGATNDDYAYSAVNFGASDRHLANAKGGIVSLTAGASHDWFAGADLSNHLKLGWGYEQALSQHSLGVFNLSVDHQQRLDYAQDSATTSAVSLGQTLRLRNSDSLTMMVTGSDTTSGNINLGHTDLATSLDYQWAKPVFGTGLSASVAIKELIYPTFYIPGFPIGRRDEYLTASLSARFDQLDYFGFAPVLGLNFARNTSSFSPYDTKTFSLSLSITSNF